jgi:hypothetical protein
MCKYAATSVRRIFVHTVIGVMSIRPIMKFGSVIAVMPFIVDIVMKWINATTVAKSCAVPVPLC